MVALEEQVLLVDVVVGEDLAVDHVRVAVVEIVPVAHLVKEAHPRRTGPLVLHRREVIVHPEARGAVVAEEVPQVDRSLDAVVPPRLPTSMTSSLSHHWDKHELLLIKARHQQHFYQEQIDVPPKARIKKK